MVKRENMMTRKEAHAEATGFLKQAEWAADQAYAYFKDAETTELVETSCGPYRQTIVSISGHLAELLRSAQDATCDDCGKLIADCGCDWSNQQA